MRRIAAVVALASSRVAFVASVLAPAGCHVIERDEIVRPGERQHIRHSDQPTAKRATLVLTDEGTLRFVEPLECPTEDVITQVAGTEVQIKPNLATFVVGVIATSIGGVSLIRGISDTDPGGSPFTYGGIGLIGAGLPFAIGPWIGTRTELIPGQPRPSVTAAGPLEPCGERALTARAATLAFRGIEVHGAIGADGTFEISPYNIVDAFEVTTVPPWDITAAIETDAGLRSIKTVIDGGALATHAKAFLAKPPFDAKVEPMRLVPGIVAGALRVSLIAGTSPAVRIALPLKNDGPGPAWQLRGHVVAVDQPALDSRVIYIGAVPKGDAREVIATIPVSLEAAANLRNAQLDLSVELHDAHGTAPATPIRFKGTVLVDATR